MSSGANSCSLCAEYGTAVEQRQRLDAQKSESEAVKKVRLHSQTRARARHLEEKCIHWDYRERHSLTTRDSLQEFASLSPENTIYKQVGPVLLKQDQDEAKANVDKRLEFISSEM